ncbi:MAG TPA: carboxypeptidase-like regulatory domain-containing protein [Candidatus Limnocylindrales bacterium]|nr:carboxypeptidase-like regulatory domain-containing protein [Candidatus Limnocylindrales bacterium]
MKSVLKCFLGIVGALTLASAVAAAPSPTGAIKGSVINPAGKVVAGVSVSVNRAKSNTHLSDVTGTTGDFVFTSLPPGDYRVTVKAKGYAPVVQPVIEVIAGKTTPDAVFLKPPVKAASQKKT